MELIRRFPAGVLTGALEDWAWLDELEGKTPVATSAFGDVLLEAEDGIWFLDTVDGTLRRRWDDGDQLLAELDTREGQDRYLLAGLAEEAHAAGLVPEGDQVLTFTVPPVLGGGVELANIELGDVAVALSVAGQIHGQVRHLPPGTPVTAVHPDDD
jgi:hypothetical protein